jgi:hypothetical protein
MPLVLHQNDEAWPREDYHVRHGELRVGRIWNNPSASANTQWVWTLNGVFSEAEAMLCHAGSAPTLPDARAALGKEWHKWLAWACLSEEAEPSASTAGADGGPQNAVGA